MSHAVRKDPKLEEKRECLERLLADPLLHGSDSLSHLLRYLADHALAGDKEPIKEYQIAREVFGRGEDFDQRMDSIARVQASRLRNKLAEYYASHGAGDRWRIELPRGGYQVSFLQQQEKSEPRPDPTVRIPATASEMPRPKSAVRTYSYLLSLTALLAIGLAYSLYLLNRSPLDKARADSPHVVNFWTSALPSPAAPLVIYSNAEFAGRPETGLRYRRPDDKPDDVFEMYTGVGEVMAIDSLNKMFRRMARDFGVKRGRLLNWDETKNRDLIFVGSPSENLPVRELPLSRNFAFRVSPGPERKGDLGIVNLQPRPGEQPVYFANGDYAVTNEFAVIELAAGATPGQMLLLLAGTTTYGTQAAAEFVCSDEHVAELQQRLGSNQKATPFSAVIQVRVQRGVPLQSKIVAFRKN